MYHPYHTGAARTGDFKLLTTMSTFAMQYASAFGVGSATPRSAVVHQWPYSTYLADACEAGTSGASGHKTKCSKGIDGIPANPNCSTLAGNGGPGITGAFRTRAAALDSLRGCPRTMA